jgi:hypothetical protein
MSNSKFAAALKKTVEPPVSEVPKAKPKAVSAVRTAAREGTKHIGGYYSFAVSRQLKSLAVTEDTTVQALLAEALNLLFQSRRLPTIAEAPKD